MIDDALKKAIAAQEHAFGHSNSFARFKQESERLAASLKAFEVSPAMTRIAEDYALQEQMLRAAFGPIEDLRRSGVFGVASQLEESLKPMHSMLEDIEKRYRLPEIYETARLFQSTEFTGVASAFKQYEQGASKIKAAMDAMRSPWVDIENSMASFTGFAELQNIGYALQSMPAFDERLSDALRIDLGDWRSNITWPDDIFSDPLARTAFYTARGFNPALTMFPSEAFEQSVDIAGLAGPLPPAVDLYDFDAREGDGNDENSGFSRTNAAHDRLQRFESMLRRSIDQMMKQAYGEDWIKHRTPGDMRKSWLDKKQNALDNGEQEYPLIAYADFTDYVQIITRKDNWNEIFKAVFQRKESVQESFQRLFPIRICTMHSRIVTQDDELYLYVEVKRISDAISKKKL